jgi:curved DNA-binding protein CbpA
MKNYYQILGIEINATKETIKKAYRLYATKFHPDKQSGDTFFEERFKEIKEAYDVLYDDIKRTKYDYKYNSVDSKKNTNTDSFDNTIFKKENELKKKEEQLKNKEKEVHYKILKLKIEEDLLKNKENEIHFKIKELEKKRSEEFVKWEKEKVVNKKNEFNERERTIYFNKGNVLITGNSLKVGIKRYELNEISNIGINIISKKIFRITGWILLLVSILTFIYIVGILITPLSLFLLFKQDKALITIYLKNHRFEYINSDKKLAFKISETIEKAKNNNIEKYQKW